MDSSQHSQNSISEIEAVYKIVFRNLQPDNYAHLMLDARPVILNEATNLLSCSELSTSKKQLLLKSLQLLRLKNHQIPFKLAHELQT